LFHYVKGDTEGIVNYGLSIKGIHFTAIFIENKEEKSSKFLSVLKVVLM
jgi:phosphoesterase RecJ-like protein